MHVHNRIIFQGSHWQVKLTCFCFDQKFDTGDSVTSPNQYINTYILKEGFEVILSLVKTDPFTFLLCHHLYHLDSVPLLCFEIEF